MLSQTAKPVTQFSEHFTRVFGLRPDYDRLINDRGYATNVLLTAQRCSDMPLKQAAFELSTMLATDGGRLSTAEDAAYAEATDRQRKRNPRDVEIDPDASRIEKASILMRETISTYLTPFKAHTLLFRLQRVGTESDIDRLLGDLQGELIRSVNTESAMQIINDLRAALK